MRISTFTSIPISTASFAQVNITEEVVARRKLADMHAQLQAEKAQMDALLHRQYQLIECLSRITEVQEHAKQDAAGQAGQQGKEGEAEEGRGGQAQGSGRGTSTRAAGAGGWGGGSAHGSVGGATSAADLIESVRRQIAGQGLASIKLAGSGGASTQEGILGKPPLEILERLGEGSMNLLKGPGLGDGGRVSRFWVQGLEGRGQGVNGRGKVVGEAARLGEGR